MQGRRKLSRTLGEHAIFGDEQAAAMQIEVAELREMLTQLAGQVHAQFTTISAHAEIAREQVEIARAEARADLERTRELLIRLCETTRDELRDGGGVRAAGGGPGPSIAAWGERFEAIDERVDQLFTLIERCFERQRVLADTIEALLDTVLAERRGEPVAGLSLV